MFETLNVKCLPSTARTVYVRSSLYLSRCQLWNKLYMHAAADPGGGGGNPSEFFFACQYMKIPADLDPKPLLLKEFGPRTPPPEEFLGPPLSWHDS